MSLVTCIPLSISRWKQYQTVLIYRQFQHTTYIHMAVIVDMTNSASKHQNHDREITTVVQIMTVKSRPLNLYFKCQQ